jgi:hypothetical protein
VRVLIRILHRILDVPSGILEDEFFTAGVIREKIGNVEDFTPVGDPTTTF